MGNCYSIFSNETCILKSKEIYLYCFNRNHLFYDNLNYLNKFYKKNNKKYLNKTNKTNKKLKKIKSIKKYMYS